ncbi:site-specific integrase [Paucibacter sp. hw8]|uniref:Site-specific integrase n=1 Tax=Roseateles albus TaxID=2987525 RepID=A0ABT5K7Q5_9BURK|nr:site-specific integrase [Roseateles albus]MDC8769989.1 site-specific integrase [Roseateles albus]
MSLYKRKDSPFWWIKLPAIRGESKPLQQSTGTGDKRQAQQVHDRLAVSRWEQDRLGVKPRRSWEEAVLRWLLETKHKATHDGDKAKLRWLDSYLGGKHLEEIDRTLIDRIKFDREKVSAGGTTNRYLALIRAILKRACSDWEWIDRVPKFNMYREAEGRVRSLTPQEFDTLCKELPEHLADMAAFSVATGLRSANVKGLEWSYVDLERRHAWIPGSKHKNGKAHSVPLNEMALAVIRKQIGKHSSRVFTYRGNPVGQCNTKAWTAALERAGIENFRWHDLRHTFATWHRLAGTPTHELQMLGGWKTGAMVERYAHLAPEALQGAANRLDAIGRYVPATDKDKRPSSD